MNRKKKWYLIDRPDESAKYLQGWAIAGRHLQALFNQYNQKLSNPYTGFCWLRTQITSPTFDSMNFRFKNNVFSVQVDFGIDKNTRRGAFVSEKRKDLQVRICENNDMIPCLFRIFGDDMTPMESGWNLTLSRFPVDASAHPAPDGFFLFVGAHFRLVCGSCCYFLRRVSPLGCWRTRACGRNRSFPHLFLCPLSERCAGRSAPRHRLRCFGVAYLG